MFRRDFAELLSKGDSVTGSVNIFEQNEAKIPSFIYQIILKHQEKEINQV